MIIIIRKIYLYACLICNYIVYFSFPTLEETLYSNLGKIYFELEKYGKAINSFEKSEKSHNYQDPSFSRFNWYYIGYCFLNLGDFKNAAQYFEKYLKLQKKDVEVLSIAGWCYEILHEFELALKYYSGAIELEPHLFPIHLQYSEILFLLGKPKEALEQLRITENNFRKPFEKEIIDSLALKFSGDLSGAIYKFTEIISKSDGDLYNNELFPQSETVIALSRLQKEIGDSIKCLRTLEEAFEKTPYDLWLNNELAFEYAEQNINLNKALDLVDQSLIYQPDNSIFLDTKGWILLKMGKTKDAEVLIHKALRLNPKCEEANIHLQELLAIEQKMT